MKRPFGKELIIDAGGCNGNMRCKIHLQKFVDELVEKLGMKKREKQYLSILRIMTITENEI